MRNSSLVFGVCLALGVLVAAGPAAADIAPPGLCDPEDVGEVCDNAIDKDGNELGKAGLCVAEKCTRGTPDGTMKYDCVMCRSQTTEPSAGGAGGGASDPNKGGSASAAGKTGKDTDDAKDDGGCSIGMGGRHTGVVTVSSLLALALAFGRRRWLRRA